MSKTFKLCYQNFDYQGVDLGEFWMRTRDGVLDSFNLWIDGYNDSWMDLDIDSNIDIRDTYEAGYNNEFSRLMNLHAIELGTNKTPDGRYTIWYISKDGDDYTQVYEDKTLIHSISITFKELI